MKTFEKTEETIFALPLTFAQYFRLRPRIFQSIFSNSKQNARRGMFHHGLLIWGDTFSGVYSTTIGGAFTASSSFSASTAASLSASPSPDFSASTTASFDARLRPSSVEGMGGPT